MLVATSVDRGVLASDDDEAKKSKSVSFQPNESETMKINITADDYHGRRSVEIPLNKTCFSNGYNECYTVIANAFKSGTMLHFNLSIGSCETRRDVTRCNECNKNVTEINVSILCYSCDNTCAESDKDNNEKDVTRCDTEQKENNNKRYSISATTTSTNATDKSSQDKWNSTSPSSLIRSFLRTTIHKIPTEAKILLMVLMVQMLGTCIMAVVVVVVIRRSSR